MIARFFWTILLSGFFWIGSHAQWTLVHSTAEVDIYEKVITIDDVINGVNCEYWVFRYENKTGSTLDLEWYFELYFDGQCLNCSGNTEEYDASLILGPNQTYESHPSNPADKRKYILRNITNVSGTELDQYIIQNLTVTIQ